MLFLFESLLLKQLENKTESKSIVRGMFQENRSDGIGVIGITQRPARMDKTSLSQCDNIVIGRVTSFRDKEAVKNYLDDPNQVKEISSYEKGEFLLLGSYWDVPVRTKIRKAYTKHSGESPKHILSKHDDIYLTYENKLVDKNTMAKESNTETVETSSVAGLIPKPKSLLSFGMVGVKMSLGAGISGLTATMLGSSVKKLPLVNMLPAQISGRTIVSTANTVALFGLYTIASKKVKNDKLNDVLFYATAGSAGYWLGSVTTDVLQAFNVDIPLVSTAVMTATGVTPATTENTSEDNNESDVDLNTSFA